MRNKKFKTKVATALMASLVLSSISPMAGYARTYTEAPIGSDDFGVPHELTEMPDVTIQVDAPSRYSEKVVGTAGEYVVRIPYEIEVKFDELASDSEASSSDWNPEEWETQILSDFPIEAVISSETLQKYESLDLHVELDKANYEIVVSVGNLEELVYDEAYLIDINMTLDGSINYPGEQHINIVSQVTLELVRPSASENVPAVPGQSPRWHPDNLGWAGCDINTVPESLREDVKSTDIQVFRDGERVGYLRTSGLYEYVDVRHLITEDGTYNISGRFCFESIPTDTDQYWSEWSEDFEYTVPEKCLPELTDLKWNPDGSVEWESLEDYQDEMDDTIRYVVKIYEKEGNEYRDIGLILRRKDNKMDASSWLEKGKTYKFRVLAEGDLRNYGNSPWSDFSPEFTPGTSEEIAENILDNLLESSDEEIVGNIENTVLEEEQKGALKLGVQTDTALADKYTELEKRYNAALGDNKVDFAVDAKEESKVDGSQVAITGGILNGATGIRFTEPSKEDMQHAGANPYRRKTAVNIKLLPETVTGELKYPVLITMPVPEGMDAEDMVIIHIRNGKEPEKIWPRDNKDGTVSFAVTEFSTFFFADSTSTGGSSGGSGGSGGGGSMGASAGAVITTDAKKGKVSSVSGIITGSTDGYSKWVSEAPLDGQTENLWKLQYADGTFATGSYVMDEQGNLVKDAAGNPTEQLMWELINGAWFAFGADGYIKTGLFFDPALNGWFYVDVNAGMKTGWQMIDGNWRYFNPNSDGTKGIMFVNRTTLDGYQVNEAGIWIQ